MPLNLGTYKILSSAITACDNRYIVEKVKKAIKNNKTLLISPVASNTLTLAYFSSSLRIVLSKFDYLVPDSQWIKWSIYFLYGRRLKKRLSGSTLMISLIEIAESNQYPVLLYGYSGETLLKLKNNLVAQNPNLKVFSKKHSSKWNRELTKLIRQKKIAMVFVALGSPRQEAFSYELKKELIAQNLNVIIVPVGAAFDFISGTRKRAPVWMQDRGFEWLHRFFYEPRRLWKRYVLLGPLFVLLVLGQKAGIISGK